MTKYELKTKIESWQFFARFTVIGIAVFLTLRLMIGVFIRTNTTYDTSRVSSELAPFYLNLMDLFNGLFIIFIIAFFIVDFYMRKEIKKVM